ncbi:CDP-glycerol glycerophosphotransferase family protein [Paenibacillus sp. 102]|uniref:CDP-glycerol glycerophosphotransferase family protein n=1 Tax=Paenibacillus sp. 102 TaxID=3120823 RepID=UPI0031BB9686
MMGAIREIIVSIYLFLFKMLFRICKLFPLQKKVTFIISYGENLFYIHEEMKRQQVEDKIVVLYKSTCKYDVGKYSGRKYRFESMRMYDTVLSTYHLATSRYVLVDNYFGFLSAVEFKHEVQCIQVWHAAGAIKKFGAEMPSVKERTRRAQERFLKVYKQFHKIVVGSDSLADIYKQAFQLSEENMIRTGIPRTDLFFQLDQQQEIIRKLRIQNEKLREKKVILYAPTFREHELTNAHIELDIGALYENLKDEYILLLRLHPAVKKTVNIQEKYQEFMYDYSTYPNINDLLLITDILITDYSSIPFEFSLLRRPMIFYPYDLEMYVKERDFWFEYESLVPGYIAHNAQDMIRYIKKGDFDLGKIDSFARKWNQYSKGDASKQLVKQLFSE